MSKPHIDHEEAAREVRALRAFARKSPELAELLKNPQEGLSQSLAQKIVAAIHGAANYNTLLGLDKAANDIGLALEAFVPRAFSLRLGGSGDCSFSASVESLYVEIELEAALLYARQALICWQQRCESVGDRLTGRSWWLKGYADESAEEAFDDSQCMTYAHPGLLCDSADVEASLERQLGRVDYERVQIDRTDVRWCCDDEGSGQIIESVDLALDEFVPQIAGRDAKELLAQLKSERTLQLGSWLLKAEGDEERPLWSLTDGTRSFSDRHPDHLLLVARMLAFTAGETA